jgi:hypothetical protein
MKKSNDKQPRPSKSADITQTHPAEPATTEVQAPAATLGTKFRRFFVLALGVVASHFLLFAPSLLGEKVLLPLDCLALQNCYLPRGTAEFKNVRPGNRTLSDQVFQFEFQRRFAAGELRAGRLPLWDPYHYCGAPFVVPFLSPFNVPYYLSPNYVTLAWTHVLVALFAAGGAYLFFRRVLEVGVWPATVIAWCFPLSAFFQMWLGYYLSYTAAFLPWLFLAVDAIIRRPFGFGGPGLAVLTGLLLISGAFDLAGQALLACGLFALWRLGEILIRDKRLTQILGPAASLTVAWMLGFLLSAPYWMPLTEYTATGLRTQRRAAGVREERPPNGISAAPQMVLPYIYGATRPGWPWMSPANNLQESAAQAFCGVFAMLVLAPLGLAERRYFSINLFWLILSFIAASWVLDFPIMTAILRLPGLNLMSHNRFLFVFCFAFLSLAVVGLDAVVRGDIIRSKLLFVPVAILVILGIACLIKAGSINNLVPDDPARSALGPRVNGVSEATYIARNNFQTDLLLAAAACAAGLLLWGLIYKTPARVAGIALSIALVGDLLWFAKDQNPQCETRLYYPDLPALRKLAKAPPGRVSGLGCLPPLLAQHYGLSDVRGYDAVDPARICNLLVRVKDPNSPAGTDDWDYATTQWWFPRLKVIADQQQFRLLPILDSLNLRYIIGRGQPPPVSLLAAAPDYWVYENKNALPRVYVPARTKVFEEAQALSRVTDEKWAEYLNPRETAYVNADPELPSDCRGTANITEETPCEVHISFDMETAGLVVLADQWYEGWHASVNGEEVPIYLVNAAVRGVKVPSGKGEVVYRYQPASWPRGLRWCSISIAFVLTWAAVAACWSVMRRKSTTPAPV